MAKSIQSTVESMDLKGQRVSSAKLNAASNIVARAFPPFGLCTANYSRAVQTTVRNQTGINQAIIACALERYRLAHAEYPEKLETLVPEFIPQLPHEIFNGQPLKYHRDDKEQFTLYSIGWDEKDDGGTPAASYGSGPDDWVWHYPAAN